MKSTLGLATSAVPHDICPTARFCCWQVGEYRLVERGRQAIVVAAKGQLKKQPKIR